MKIEFELTQDLYDLHDAVFLALLKGVRRDANYKGKRYIHPDDRKLDKKIVKACDVLIDYFTVKEG